MGQFRYVGPDARKLVIGNPRPALVEPDMAFTVDDDADESYANCPAIYQVVQSAPPAVTPPVPANPGARAAAEE